jgi:hypothetical protein
MLTEERRQEFGVPTRNKRRKRLGYLLVAVVAALFLPSLCFRVVNGPAYKQRRNEVVVREPGERFLGPPRPVGQEARKDLEFAWL